MKIDLERREIICGNISELMKFLDISRSDLAKELGINPMSISNWSSGKCIPRQSTWLALRFICRMLSKEIYGNENAVEPSFDIPNVKMTDLVRWQMESVKFEKVPSYIGS